MPLRCAGARRYRTPDTRGAAALVDQPCQDVDQRGLPRAIGAEQAEHAAARDIEGNVGERLLAALVSLGQIGDGDGGGGEGGHGGHLGRMGRGSEVRRSIVLAPVRVLRLGRQRSRDGEELGMIARQSAEMRV